MKKIIYSFLLFLFLSLPAFGFEFENGRIIWSTSAGITEYAACSWDYPEQEIPNLYAYKQADMDYEYYGGIDTPTGYHILHNCRILGVPECADGYTNWYVDGALDNGSHPLQNLGRCVPLCADDEYFNLDTNSCTTCPTGSLGFKDNTYYPANFIYCTNCLDGYYIDEYGYGCEKCPGDSSDYSPYGPGYKFKPEITECFKYEGSPENGPFKDESGYYKYDPVCYYTP